MASFGKKYKTQTVYFPDLNREVNFAKLTDEEALRLYIAGKTDYVWLLPKADKSLFDKLSADELEALKAKLPKTELKKLTKLLG